MKKPCECELCQQIREHRRRLLLIPETEREYFQNIFDALIQTEMDRDYYKGIVQGIWPDADETIKKYRKKNEEETNVSTDPR